MKYLGALQIIKKSIRTVRVHYKVPVVRRGAIILASITGLMLLLPGCEGKAPAGSADYIADDTCIEEEDITGMSLTDVASITNQDEAEIVASRGSVEDAVVISWKPIPDATGYILYRSMNYTGPYLPIGTRAASDGRITFADKNADEGKYYWYRVRPVFAYVITGSPTKKAQGWVRTEMIGRMDKTGLITNILESLPHFFNVRSLARKCLKTLPEPVNIDGLIQSNAEIFQYVKDVCATPHRRIGSAEGLKAEAYVFKTLSGILGSANVKMDPVECDVYRAETWGLEVTVNGEKKSIDCFYAVNTGITYDRPAGGSETGNMVWAGEGTADEFDALGDITGKIVVANCEFPDLPVGLLQFLHDDFYYTSDPTGAYNLTSSLVLTFARSNLPPEYSQERYEESVYWQALNRGAKGLVLVLKNHPGDTNTHWGPYDGKMERPIPCLYVSSYMENEIRQLAESGTMATVTINGSIKKGTSNNIYGFLPGMSEETILVSTHHDSAHKGATEDGTGVAMVMAMAKAWSQVPLEKRTKSMLFVFAAGHFYAGKGSEEFAERHKDDILKNVIVDINLEHLGAKNAVDDGSGNLVSDGEMALSIIFATEDPVVIASSMRMLERHQPESTILVQSNLLGSVPPGEAGHYHVVTGMDFIHWIATPYYLLTSEDTLDRVDVDKLNPLARSVSEFIGTYMALPVGYKYLDD